MQSQKRKTLVKEPPVVDVAKGMFGPLPQKAQAGLSILHWVMRSRLGAIIFLLIALFIGALPVIAIPPVFFFLEWSGLASHWAVRRCFDLCCGNWMSVMTFVYENMLGIRVRTFGYDGNFERRSIMIMNHVSHFDWMYFWSVVDRQGDLSYWKPVTKRHPLRNLPILGQCMQMSNYLFVYRKWEFDKSEFRNKLYYLNALHYPLQFLIFPEGGDFTAKTKRLSDQYALENDLPFYSYCFHPRTTGFKYTMNALRDGGLDAIYDVTIGFPDLLPKTELDIGKGIMPREVHFHIRRYEEKDIPKDQDELKNWVKDRWREKEVELEYFYIHKEFREKSEVYCSNGSSIGNGHNIGTGNWNRNGHGIGENGSPLNGHSKTHAKSTEVIRGRNVPFLLYSMFVFLFTNTVITLLMLYISYFWLYMVFGCCFLAYGNRTGFDYMYMASKKREIDEAVRNSEFNSD